MPTWRKLLRRPKDVYQPLDHPGADVLLVVARHPANLALIETIPDVRKRFGRIHAFVTDSYHHQGCTEVVRAYESITVTAEHDVAFPRDRFGIKVHQMYQGADCLRWAPQSLREREID